MARPSNIIEPRKLSPNIPYFCPRAMSESPTHTEMKICERVRKVSISRARAKERKTKRNISVYVIHHIDLSSDPTTDDHTSTEKYIFHASIPIKRSQKLPKSTTSLFDTFHGAMRLEKIKRKTLLASNKSFGNPVTE